MPDNFFKKNKNMGYNASSSSPKSIPQTGIEKMFTDYRKQQEELSCQNKAKNYGISYVNLLGYPINPQTIAFIPEETAIKYQAVAFLKAEGQLTVASVDPTNKEMQKEIIKIATTHGFEPIFAMASASSIQYALRNYRYIPKAPTKEDINLTQVKQKDYSKEIQNLADLKDKISEVPTTQIFEIILAGAVKSKASDVHIEPVQFGMNLRYRIDGVLQDVAQLPIEPYRALLSRVKYLAKMKMDVKDQAQNGRFSIKAIDIPIDLRVSTLPTIYGENIVMRLLEHGKGFLTLDQLEFSDDIKDMVEKEIKKPSGMILNTGPTGSGKTTTLYAILDKINKPGVKIITLEDPVEYRLTGINQTQIDTEKGMDFATSLKSSLRQDPDILMVGEIRDMETAEAAIQAANTGHLVLSTLHTNNAPAALPRLIDLGVKPFLLPGAINIVMAQRLVRRICEECKEQYAPKPEVMKKIKKVLEGIDPSRRGRAEINIKIPSKLWQGRGCSQCNKTGFSGRVPIAEAFVPSQEIEKMVMDRAPISELYRKAVELGMITMAQDGIRKVFEGLTTIGEIWRVTASDE